MMLIKQADEGGAGYRELIERELSARLVTRARAGAPSLTRTSNHEETTDAASRSGPGEPRRESVAAQFCTACGTGNDRDAAFCKRCGARLDAVTA